MEKWCKDRPHRPATRQRPLARARAARLQKIWGGLEVDERESENKGKKRGNMKRGNGEEL